MTPLRALAVVLAWNYTRHRRGMTTICSEGRTYLPPLIVTVGWPGFAWVMWRHLLNGYPHPLD